MVEIETDVSDEETTTNTQQTAAEKARAEAEARRKRILEKSQLRLGIVSGDVKQPDGDVEEEKEEAASTSTGAARLAAMRRRRFKKASAGGGGEKTEAATTDKEDATKPPEAETSADDVKEEPAATKAEPAHDDDAPKKKYKGVAKMRRQMLKEKQQKEAATATKSDSAVTTTKIPMAKKPHIRKIPIIMHILTIAFLFVAGLDVGFHLQVSPEVTIHRTLAPQQYGIGVWNHFAGDGNLASDIGASDAKERLMEASQEWSATEGADEQEFDKAGGSEAAQEDEYVPNIDPLFQLDLDKLAEGDGLFKMFARFAVACHRVNLAIFYYLPRAVFSALMSLPNKLLATPPILCLVSLVTRQFAKRILGASLPTPLEETAKEDVLAMLKQYVMNFFKSSFPTIVELYDAFTNLRADMFVILCGVFVGLTYSHSIEKSAGPRYGTGDEL